MDNEFLLYDRLEKIRSTIKEYGEKNFCISFSGGKDSCVLSALIDEALPGNEIPRVYANTGIEYNAMVSFVRDLKNDDDRIQIIEPSVPIKPMLEKEGYPFKSKWHSQRVAEYQRAYKFTPTTAVYARRATKEKLRNDRLCPKCLLHQFKPEYDLKISDNCCFYLKEEPLLRWQMEHRKEWAITGIMQEEGGRRERAKCIAFARTRGKLNKFNPLSVATKEWENWYLGTRAIKLCSLYYPPFSFARTGCKGCPFNIQLQQYLDMLACYFPAERRQCEYIWAPVYAEYRRLGYRLRKTDEGQQIEWWEVTK